MKKFTQKAILILLVFTLFSLNKTVKAQKVTALVSNGVTTVYGGGTQFADAYNAAADGDTIYLPGGPVDRVYTIDKRIAIFGAGYHPDSTMATSKTYITSGFYFQQNADSASITGVEVNGGISTYNNHKVDYLVISRCKVTGIGFGGNGSTPCEHVTVKECIVAGSINLVNATYSNVSNNIVGGQMNNGSNNAIYNNIFLYYHTNHWGTPYPCFNGITNSHIANNIVFDHLGNYATCSTNTFSNNIFGAAPTDGSNTYENNYNSVDITTVFVNQTGNHFDFSHDYHLASPSTYKGFDNTVVGIYGGLFPFKDGGLPENPHIQTKDIALKTKTNGDLHIEFNVAAQDK
jgi:hypothetical protein